VPVCRCLTTRNAVDDSGCVDSRDRRWAAADDETFGPGTPAARNQIRSNDASANASRRSAAGMASCRISRVQASGRAAGGGGTCRTGGRPPPPVPRPGGASRSGAPPAGTGRSGHGPRTLPGRRTGKILAPTSRRTNRAPVLLFIR
jgi:hypothetical protein